MCACILFRRSSLVCECVYFSALLPSILLHTRTMCAELMSLNAFKYYGILFSSFIFVYFAFVSNFFCRHHIWRCFCRCFCLFFTFGHYFYAFVCTIDFQIYVCFFPKKKLFFFFSPSTFVNAHHESTNLPSHSYSLTHTRICSF